NVEGNDSSEEITDLVQKEKNCSKKRKKKGNSEEEICQLVPNFEISGPVSGSLSGGNVTSDIGSSSLNTNHTNTEQDYWDSYVVRRDKRIGEFHQFCHEKIRRKKCELLE